MKIFKSTLLCLFFICAVASVCFAQDSNTKSAYLCVKGIIFDSERPIAIINDKYIEEGQKVLGVTVLKISDKSVQFEYEGEAFSKEVGQDCLKVVSPTEEVIYLGGRRESLKDIISKFAKLSTSDDARSKAELEDLERKLTNYFQQNMGLVIGLVLLLLILPYVYMAITLQMIATKTGTESAWLAWVPIFSLYLECKIAGKPGWWLFLRILTAFIPFAGPIITSIITIIIWMGISEARSKPTWLGIFSIVPLLNFFMLGYLAFSKGDSLVEQKKAEAEQSTVDLGTAKRYKA